MKKGTGSLSHKFFARDTLHDPEYDLPYMERVKFGRLRFHKMLRGDTSRNWHDHPWWFITFPLTSYVEEVLTLKNGVWEARLNVVKAWRFHFRRASYAHRILGPVVEGVNISELYQPPGRDNKQNTVYWIQKRMDELNVPTHKRHIRTIVLQGKPGYQWGFYLVALGTVHGTWLSCKQYFKRRGWSFTQSPKHSETDNPRRLKT